MASSVAFSCGAETAEAGGAFGEPSSHHSAGNATGAAAPASLGSRVRSGDSIHDTRCGDLSLDSAHARTRNVRLNSVRR